MLGLYEWSRKKTAAIKKKADDIGMKKFFCEIDFTKKKANMKNVFVLIFVSFYRGWNPG